MLRRPEPEDDHEDHVDREDPDRRVRQQRVPDRGRTSRLVRRIHHVGGIGKRRLRAHSGAPARSWYPTIASTTSRRRDLGRRSRQRDHAVAQHDDPVGDREDARQVVRDHHHAEAAVGRPADQLADDIALARAQRRGGLVHQDARGAPHRGPRNGDRLLLAAGERRDRNADGGQLDLQGSERLLGLARHRAARDHPDLSAHTGPGDLAAEEHVLEHREVGRERQILVDGGDAVALGVADRVHLDALGGDLEVARVGYHDAAEALREGRLASAVVAEDRDHLTAVQLERDVVQRTHMPVDLADAVGGDDHVARGQVWSIEVADTRQPGALSEEQQSVCLSQTPFGDCDTLSHRRAGVKPRRASSCADIRTVQT